MYTTSRQAAHHLLIAIVSHTSPFVILLFLFFLSLHFAIYSKFNSSSSIYCFLARQEPFHLYCTRPGCQLWAQLYYLSFFNLSYISYCRLPFLFYKLPSNHPYNVYLNQQNYHTQACVKDISLFLLSIHPQKYNHYKDLHEYFLLLYIFMNKLIFSFAWGMQCFIIQP